MTIGFPPSISSGNVLAQCEAARDVLVRLLGERAMDFQLHLVAETGGCDWFELKVSRGRAVVKAPSTIGLCRGVYHYLRQSGQGMVSWSGKRIDLPASLPDFAEVRVECPNALRYYLNVCTFGYTTAFWNWERWERELDWMALHGINMPLAHVGQEEIWRRVWRHYGISDEELSRYFTGPSHLPWHRMGNINSHDGPLPDSWHVQQVELQHRILGRMRELGMQPVAPAFGGFVPAGLKRVRSEVALLEANAWAGFESDCQTFLLSPDSELFAEIGERFLREYTREFGPVHYYLADPLNEVELPPLNDGREAFLASLGSAIANSIEAADPDGIWVMQGWMFHFHRNFWSKRAVQAFLGAVPNERMIVIDLCNELFKGWQHLDAFYGKPWMYGVVHNFGGNNPLNGDLAFYCSEPANALASDKRGAYTGFAICPEGIENNELVYELLTDVAWSAEPLELSEWVSQYIESRYGPCPAELHAAWQAIVESVYTGFNTNIRHGLQGRPSLQPKRRVNIGDGAREAIARLLRCSSIMQDVPLLVQDAVELAAHYLGGCVDARLRDAGLAHAAGLADFRDTCIDEAVDLMLRIDGLIAAHPTMRLDRWIEAARATGTSLAEKDYYEKNARRLLTRWGGPGLSDYSARLWSGLIRDYYVGRWRTFFAGLRGDATADVRAFEEQWINANETSKVTMADDPIAEAQKLFAAVDGWERKELQQEHAGDCIGHWAPERIARLNARLEWNVSDFMLSGGEHQVRFSRINGQGSLRIHVVRLLENGVEVAGDSNGGVVGPHEPLHVSRLTLEARKPGTDYVISAEVSAENGTDSSGAIWLTAGDFKLTPAKLAASAS